MSVYGVLGTWVLHECIWAFTYQRLEDALKPKDLHKNPFGSLLTITYSGVNVALNLENLYSLPNLENLYSLPNLENLYSLP